MRRANKMVCFASSMLLAGAICVAQTGQGSTPSVGSRDQDSSMAGQAGGAVLRGCLSGSADNYTLTDHNGSIYHLVGAGSQLQNAVGHEVEVMGVPDAQRTGASDDATTNTASSFQVTGIHDVASMCDHRGSSRTGSMNENPRNPDTDSQPKGAPGEGVPPKPQPESGPQLMATLQQPSSTDTGSTASQSSSSTMSSPSNATDQTSQSVGTTGPAQTTPPPVTSETPAVPQSPTDPNAQMGTGAANPTGTGAAAGTTAAQQSGGTASPSSTNPTSGASAASTAVTSSTSAGATSTDATSGASATPQNPQNDQNKPLYERQATDVPWASHSSTTSSTTTTTTSPQPQPQQ